MASKKLQHEKMSRIYSFGSISMKQKLMQKRVVLGSVTSSSEIIVVPVTNASLSSTIAKKRRSG
jgi:hypothetical protein